VINAAVCAVDGDPVVSPHMVRLPASQRCLLPGDRVAERGSDLLGTVRQVGWDYPSGAQCYVVVEWDKSKGSVGAAAVSDLDFMKPPR
jgi:hypothetical protein